MTEKLASQLKFLAAADGLKSVQRQTWLLDKTRQENSAEHSWHFALMAMTLFEHCGIEGVDLNRVIKMAIVHDLVEVYAGDAPAFDKSAQVGKEAKEQAAADKLFGLLSAAQAAEYRTLWEEFDAMQTPDALYAAAIDVLQSFYNQYNTGGPAWIKYHGTVEQAYKRMLPVKAALPSLWNYIEVAIADATAKGWLIP